MPAFKFNYFNPNFGYAVFSFRPSISFEFQAEHLPDSSNFEISVPCLIFEVEGINADLINLPLLDFSFEVLEADTTLAEFNVGIPALLFSVEEAEDVGSIGSLLLEIRPLVIIDLEVPDLEGASFYFSTKIGVFLDVAVPILANFSIQTPLAFFDFIAHEAARASFFVSLNSIKPLFFVTMEPINSTNIELPTLNFNFFALTENTVAELNFALPLLSSGLRLIHIKGEDDDHGDVIRFNYEEWMFESLKELSPDYTDKEIITHIQNMMKGAS